jgi:type IV pilus assembly protein PilM
MVEFLFRQKMQPIGLDIGHSLVKMIQLSRRDQSIRVEAAEEEKIDRNLESGSDPWRQQVIELLQKMYRRGGFTGGQVISSIPSDLLKIKSFRLDTDAPEQIEAMIQAEAAGRFGIDPTRDEVRHMVAGNVYQGEEIKNEVLFFGVNREQLTAHIRLLEQANLVPVSIDTVPCALFRSFQATLRRREDRDVVSVFADLGSKYTTVIIGRGQEITFVKQIPIAGDQFNQQVASALGIDCEEAAGLRIRLRDSQAGSIDAETTRAIIDAMTNSIEELAHEISLCFKYYAVTFRGKRPAEAVFAGGEAYEAALMDALRRHLGVEIRIAEPLRGYDLSKADFNRRRNPQMCEWAVAVGLALKGMELEQEPAEQSVMATNNA